MSLVWLELVEFIQCWWRALISSMVWTVLDLACFKPHGTTVVLAEKSRQPPASTTEPIFKGLFLYKTDFHFHWKKWTVLSKVHLRTGSKDLLLYCDRCMLTRHKRMQCLTTPCLFFLTGEWQRLWDGVWTVCTLLQGLSGRELLMSILNVTVWIKHTFLPSLIIQNTVSCFSLVSFL